MSEPSLVQQFLADRDAPCPGCGYNLRGIGGQACPECSRPVVLTVQDGTPSPWTRRLLVLALWTLLVWGALSVLSNAFTLLQYSALSGGGGLPAIFQVQAFASLVLHVLQCVVAATGLVRWRRAVRSGLLAPAFAHCVRLVMLLVIAHAGLVTLWYVVLLGASLFGGLY